MTDESRAMNAWPRLSVVHFLVWTGLTALVLAEQRLRGGLMPDLPREFWRGFEYVVAAICNGAGLGGILLWIAWRRRGVRFPVEPGQWLLVMQGAQYLCDVLISSIWLLSRATGFGPSAAHWRSYEYAFLTVPIIQFVVPAIWCRCGAAWRCFLWFAASVQTLQLLEVVHLQLASSPSVFALRLRMVGGYAACAALLALIAASDWYRRVLFSWVHWLGVATILASLLTASWMWALELAR